MASLEKLKVPTFPLIDTTQNDILTACVRGCRPLHETNVPWVQPNIQEYMADLNNVIDHFTQRRDAGVSSFPSILPQYLPSTSYLKNFLLPYSTTRRRVCGLWRDIVLSTSILWSTVVLDLDYNSHSPRILTEYLRRSGSHPLYIGATFEHECLSQCCLPAYGREVFNVLTQASHRWRVVELRIADQLLEPLMSVAGTLEQLEEFYLSPVAAFNERDDNEAVFFNAGDVEKVSPMKMLLHLPSLRRADFRGFCMDEATTLLGASSLTHYAFELSDYLKVDCIRQYPLLDECYVHIAFADSFDSVRNSAEPIRHDNIRYLSTNTSQVLQFLDLPALDNVCFDVMSSDDLRVADVAEFLHRSKCVLSSFNIWMHYDSEDQSLCTDVVGLSEIQSARSLNITFDGHYCDAGICRRLSEPGVMPEMRLFILGVGVPLKNVTQSWIDGLMSMLKLRCKEETARELKVCRLERLRFCCDSKSVHRGFWMAA
ncbi:hypothetical protein CPB85DRAFT_1430162 [Mucidula mucida]|nr:hypothetical protein CPB85DRAFT_1430162 [Mucidula mucida]